MPWSGVPWVDRPAFPRLQCLLEMLAEAERRLTVLEIRAGITPPTERRTR